MPVVPAALPLSAPPADSHIATIAGVEASLPWQARFVAVDTATAAADAARTGVAETWITIKNSGDREQTIRLDLTLTPRSSSQTQGLAFSHNVSLAPRSDLRVPLPSSLLARADYGLHDASIRLTTDGGQSSSATDVLALYPRNPQPARGESIMPIGFATGAALATPRLLEIASTLGFEYYRFNAVWSEVQPREKQWRWDRLDARLALLRQYNFRWHVTTTGSTRWSGPGQRFDPPRLDAWRDWITALARRYHDDIQLWEVWNEPNLPFFTGTVDQYDQLQRVAHDAIKAVSPDLPVTSGGYAGINHGRSKPGAFEAAFRAYPESCDWFAYHMHDAFPQFFNDLHIRLPEAARRARGDGTFPPLVFTETGFDTRFGQSFQASTLAKKMTYAAAIGAKSYTWYNLMDRAGRDTPEKPGHTFGLITNPTGTGDFASIEDDIRPKESFAAAATAIRLLRHARPLETWAQDGRYFAWLFALPENTRLLVAWTEGEATPDTLRVVRTGSPQTVVTKLDIFGNPTPVPSTDDLALVQFAAAPCYYLFRGGDAPPASHDPLVMLSRQIVPDSSGNVSIDFSLTNPLSRPLVLTAPEPLTIPARETAVLPLRRAIPPGAFGDIHSLSIPFAFANLPWTPSLRVPVVFNTLDATSPAGQRFTLRELRHVTNKQDHDPHTLHLLWSGPNDLSVQGTLRAFRPASSSTIRLRIELEVTDNTLHPAASGSPLLDGDALELGWASASGSSGRLEIAADPGDSPRVAGDPAHRRALASAVIRSEPARNPWEGPRIHYTLELDLSRMGLTKTDLASGFRFNLALHDNDGDGPKSWIALAPGLGGPASFRPSDFPFLRAQAAR